jgi:hypothetical protein
MTVIWYNARGYWDHTILNLFFDADTKYVDSFDKLEDDGAVVVLCARWAKDEIDEINRRLSRLKWAVVFWTGNEDMLFVPGALKHPNMRIWVQMPVPGLDPEYRRLPNGPTPGLPIGIPPKTLDWAFLGQVTHQRRRDCHDALSGLPNGFLYGSNGFTQGLPHAEYLQKLAEAKIAPCPSGPMNPDSFRVYEALELGCVPIVDSRTVSDRFPMGYWETLFGNDFPLPQITDWSTIGDVIAQQLALWPENQIKCFGWWVGAKAKMQKIFRADLEELKLGA